MPQLQLVKALAMEKGKGKRPAKPLKAAGDERQSPPERYPTLDEAAARLFPAGTSPWQPGFPGNPWTRPLPSLRELDNKIAKLFPAPDHPDAAHQRAMFEKRSGWNCPYRATRKNISWAVHHAWQAKEWARSARKRRDDSATLAEDLRRIIAKIDIDHDAIRTSLNRAADRLRRPPQPANARPPAYPGVADRNAALKSAKAFADQFEGHLIEAGEVIPAALAALNLQMSRVAAVADALEQRETERKREEMEGRDPWRTAFCEQLALLWYDLTGEESRAAPPRFIRFVEASWEAIGGEPGYDWRQSVRNALTTLTRREQAGRRWQAGRGKWERELHDPDAKAITETEFSEWKNQRETEKRREAAEAIAALRKQTAEIDPRVEIICLWDFWNTGTDDRRAFLESKGIAEVMPAETMAAMRAMPPRRSIRRLPKVR